MTIGFNGLGNSGRLGNQLFQYASLRGIAANRGFNFVFPPPYDSIDNYGVHECFKLDGIKEENVAFLNTQQGVQEAHFHFDENLYNNCPDNVNLLGCYQTEKYFKEIEDVIRNDLQFQDEILKPCEEMMSGFDTRPIMLHVRRGDPNLADKRGFKWAYTNLQDHHPLQPIEYYEKALEHFPEDTTVIVFSDSIDWCKEQEFFSADRFHMSESTDKHEDGALVPFVDLCLMSLCDGGITANSSLSWWGGYLQKDRTRKLISPKMWFGKAYNHDTSDIVPENKNWIEL